MGLRLKNTDPAIAGVLRPDLPAAVTAARRREFASRRALSVTARLPGSRAVLAGPLRLCYLAPRTDVGGGSRILFEHGNRLTAHGHEVTVLSHFPRPDWIDVRARFVQVPFGVELTSAVPACDVIVCGYWDQILAARALGKAPVVHFEQGDFHLFEEIDRETFGIASRNLSAADATITVSATVATVLESRFGVTAGVVGNAVDRAVFTPNGPPAAADRPYLLFVGWDGNAFKGMDEMRRVYSQLTATGRPLDLVWVTPRPPLVPLGRVVVAPDQPTLGALFRGAAAYVCCSRYESFSLPCLEAMAAGTPVVATRNTGVLEYARDGENALLADIGDVAVLAAQTARVLDDPLLSQRLREGGLNTADAYSWDVIVGRLDGAYRAAAGAWTPPSLPPGWVFALDGLAFTDPSAPSALRRMAAATAASAIAVPVSYPAFEGHRAVRWRVVARRGPATSNNVSPEASAAIGDAARGDGVAGGGVARDSGVAGGDGVAGGGVARGSGVAGGDGVAGGGVARGSGVAGGGGVARGGGVSGDSGVSGGGGSGVARGNGLVGVAGGGVSNGGIADRGAPISRNSALDADAVRAYLPAADLAATAGSPPAGVPYAAAMRDFAAGRIEAALDGFMTVFQRPGARAEAGRWVVLCLLELGRDVEAAELVSGAVREFPDHSDYQYLQAMVGRLTGRRVDRDAYAAAIAMLGPATHYAEWFEDPASLIRGRF
ncbi:glycosyltransferase family 4 protein [Dactylosporangium sp. CS-047395]|uniref:glycosyltransferase family 4 protein n=1 Tax=Dactylosporangium sp. CS-047395 TaxID=3239936 RepID=UPI003D8B21ED